jgi:anti-anti-sigma factor
MATRELEVSVDGGVLELHGDVNSSAEQAMMAGYEQAVAAGPADVTLDFSDADYINSTGIAVIVGLLAQARTQGVEVKAIGLSDHYREIFEITRLADFMTIEGSSDA